MSIWTGIGFSGWSRVGPDCLLLPCPRGKGGCRLPGGPRESVEPIEFGKSPPFIIPLPAHLIVSASYGRAWLCGWRRWHGGGGAGFCRGALRLESSWRADFFFSSLNSITFPFAIPLILSSVNVGPYFPGGT